jgi:hypothetical protein
MKINPQIREREEKEISPKRSGSWKSGKGCHDAKSMSALIQC